MLYNIYKTNYKQNKIRFFQQNYFFAHQSFNKKITNQFPFIVLQFLSIIFFMRILCISMILITLTFDNIDCLFHYIIRCSRKIGILHKINCENV